jgi:hypothetical protein
MSVMLKLNYGKFYIYIIHLWNLMTKTKFNRCNTMIMVFAIVIVSTNLLTNTSFGLVSNSSSQKITNTSISIPAICNDKKCLPQLYVSIPINQTLIKNMSTTDLANFKDSHLKAIGNYIENTINIAKTGSLKTKMDFCDTLPPPGCVGITPPTNESVKIP